MSKPIDTRNRISPAIWLVLLLAGFFSACNPEESCISEATNQYIIGFRQLNDQGVAVADTLDFDRIWVPQSNLVFYERSATAAIGLIMELDPAADMTTFVFELGDNADTLQVSYDRHFRMISPDCGLEIRYTNVEIVHHTFENVEALTEELTETTEGYDVEIYQ